MLKCIIIEDQPPAQQILQQYIDDTDHLALEKIFSDAIEARAYLEKNTIDLLFLDIKLPKVSGIAFLKSFKDHPPTILTTAYSDYALEGYEYNVVDYLLKPFSFERFSQAVNKVLALMNTESLADNLSKNVADTALYIKLKHEIVKINREDILHIKSDGDYTEIVTESQKHLSTYSLKDWLQKLDDSFCQVHKSYIINLNHLKKISQNKIYQSVKYIIPIGRAYKKKFMKKHLKQ